MEDILHGIKFTVSITDFHHHITPLSSGIVGSIFTSIHRFTRLREKKIIKEKKELLLKRIELESSFKTLVEQTPAIIEIYDTTGLQISVNKAYEKLWGFPANTTVNSFNLLKSKEVRETGLIDYVNKAYKGEVVKVPEYEFDPRGETESKGFGRNRWLSTNLFPLKDSQGKVKNIVITHEDISDRKHSEDELKKAKVKAEESDKLKTIFLNNLSHEIRTPMNGILGFSQLLKRQDLESDRQKMYIDLIKKSGYRMLNIINELIDISRIESGEIRLNIEKVNLKDLLNELYIFFYPEASEKYLELKIKYSQTNNFFFTDKNRLFQIFSNLIKNALKFTEEGYIKLGYKSKDNKIEFFVEDTGPGIAKELYNKVFERFKQGDISPKKSQEGLGLGLAISKGLIEKMGGKIKFHSKVGEGTCFSFSLKNNFNAITVTKKNQNFHIKSSAHKNNQF